MLTFFIPLLLSGSALKEEIAAYQERVTSLKSEQERGEAHYKLASAYFRDQEVTSAFHHFLDALKLLPPQPEPPMGAEEESLYKEALAHYLRGGGSQAMLDKYGDKPREWIHLNFLLATAYANLGLYGEFFDRFYQGYPYLSNSFIAHKTRGILYLRLSSTTLEREACQQEAFYYLTKALNANPHDGSLYKLLIFLAKDAKKDSLVLNYLEKIVEHEVPIARSDIFLYVREAVNLGYPAIGQKIVDLAHKQYDYSRAITDAQEYLNRG